MSARRHTKSHTLPSLTSDETIAIIRTGPWPAGKSERDRFLEWEFLRWAWEARFPAWTMALRSLAVTLRGLEGAGLVERRRVRDAESGRARRLVTLTRQGQCILEVLGGGAVPKDAE